MRVRRAGGLLLGVLLGALGAAPAGSAQDLGGDLPVGCAPGAARCEEGPLHRWRAVDEPFGEAVGSGGGLDTGWQPPGSPVQLRFVARFAGRTEVELEGRPRASWPEALSVGMEGTAGSGRLRLDHGLELRARLRFDLRVGGVRYRWEGDVPLGGLPGDLALRDEASFDSMAFAPAEGAEAADATGRVPLARYDALGGLVDVPGVGGGVAITGEMRLSARYHTTAIELSDAPSGPAITEEGGIGLRSPAGPFGPSFEVPLTPVGEIAYDGQLVLVPTVYLSFPGGARRDFDLGEIPVPWRATRTVRFDTLRWEVPLPDLEPPPEALDFGQVPLGGRRELLLAVRNRGEAPLQVTLELGAAAGPFSLPVEARQVPPRSSVRLPVRFEPTAAGPARTVLLLRSDDPDGLVHEVRLRGEGMAPPEPEPVVEPPPEAGAGDAGVAAAPSAGGCGCRVRTGQDDGAAGWLPWMGLLAWLGLRRRRAQHSLRCRPGAVRAHAATRHGIDTRSSLDRRGFGG